MRIHKEKQLKALWEVATLGQKAHPALSPTRNERKAAKYAYRVLKEQKATPR